MDPVTASLIMSGVKLGGGVKQYLEGRKLGKGAIRPEAEVPQGLLDAMESQRRLTGTRLPGQAQAEAGIEEATATGIEKVTEAGAGSGSILNTIANLQKNEQTARENLAISAAQNYVQQSQRMQDLSLKMGEEEKRLFEINQMQPFKDKAAAASALQGSGMANIFGALNQGLGSFSLAEGGTNVRGTTPADTTTDISPFGDTETVAGMTTQETIPQAPAGGPMNVATGTALLTPERTEQITGAFENLNLGSEEILSEQDRARIEAQKKKSLAFTPGFAQAVLNR